MALGLHSAANAAKEMGGSLTASSEGPGHGATFTLELPDERRRQLPTHGEIPDQEKVADERLFAQQNAPRAGHR